MLAKVCDEIARDDELSCHNGAVQPLCVQDLRRKDALACGLVEVFGMPVLGSVEGRKTRVKCDEQREESRRRRGGM